MPRAQKTYDIETLINMLGDQMNTVYAAADADLTFNEQLKLLDTLGKTCSRIAGLISQQRKLEDSDPDQLSAVLSQVLNEIRSK